MATGGHILIHTLAKHHVERVFCVAGESYLPALDALLDFPAIDVITCRHESGATFMAETYGALTGRPGVAFVTRGPGACNASIGVHAAMQSSTPLVMFVGLVGISDRDKEAFQEFDLAQMFDSHTKWSAVVDSADRLAEYTARAIHIASSGRPGPVVIGLPEEVLTQDGGDVLPKAIPAAQVHTSAKDITRVIDALSGAEKPLIIAGGGGWDDQACADLAGFASASHIPVCAAFRRQDVVNHKSNHYAGELGTGPNPALVESVKKADVVLYLNGRFSEITTQNYSLFQDGQTVIHVYPDADEFGKGHLPDITVQSHVGPFISALAAKRVDGRKWAGWRDELRQQYVAWSTIEKGESAAWNGADMTQIFAFLQEALPEDAIVTTDAGNFSGWCQRYLRYGRPGRLMAPISGGMGLSVPAAVGASIQYPVSFKYIEHLN